MVRVSCSLWGYRDWPREKALEDIGKIGYKGVEIVMHHLGTPIGYHLNQNALPLNSEEMDKLKRELSENNLRIVCLSPSSDFLVPPSVRQFVPHLPSPDDATVLRKVIDLAVELGKPLVRPFPCADKPTYMSMEEALNVVIRGLKDITAYAASLDVKIALDVTHSRVTNTVNNAIKILEKVDSDYFGFNIHTVGKLAILLAEALIANGWGDKIFHTHLLDAKRMPGKPFGEPVPLGEGDNYIEEFLILLKDAKYSGWYNFEGKREDAKAAYDYLIGKIKELDLP